MVEIMVAHGLCSAIRPRVLTALPPAQYPSLHIETWGQGKYGIPGTDLLHVPDADAWASRHIALISVPGDESFAKWVEYVLCRYMAANPGYGMVLLSQPLDPRNRTWAAKWDSLPPNWRQVGCVVKPQGKQQPAKKSAKKTSTQPARRGGLLIRIQRLLEGL